MSEQMNHETTQPAQRAGDWRGFVQRNTAVLLVAAVLVIALIAMAFSWLSGQSRLQDQQEQIVTLTEDLEGKKAAHSEQIDADLISALGVSRDRLERDEHLISGFVDTAFTWESGATYEEARQKLITSFDLSEDSTFLTEFMPPSRFNEDEDGTRYYYIDVNSLKSSVNDDLEAEVVEVSTTDYTYAVQVTVQVTSGAIDRGDNSPASVSTERRMLLLVTVDADGDLFDLSGVPASGSTRHSD